MLGLDGVRGLTIAFSDNNGITRSRTVPFAKLDEAVERGVGITSLFPVFTSTDGITFAHEPLSTPSGDLRLLCHAGPGETARGPARVRVDARAPFEQDGSRSVYCQRGALERQVERAAEAGSRCGPGSSSSGSSAMPMPSSPRRTTGRSTDRSRCSRWTSSARSCWPTSMPTASWSASCTRSTASRRWSSRSAPPTPWPRPTCSC